MGHLTTLAQTVVILQTEVDPVPEELADADVVLLRAAAFAVGFAVVVILGWGIVEPAISRLVKVRNRHNQTLREAITRYVRLIVLVVALAVSLSAPASSTSSGTPRSSSRPGLWRWGSLARTSSDRSSAGRPWSSIRNSTWATTSAGRAARGKCARSRSGSLAFGRWRGVS
jgi:hypothetical protein